MKESAFLPTHPEVTFSRTASVFDAPLGRGPLFRLFSCGLVACALGAPAAGQSAQTEPEAWARAESAGFTVFSSSGLASAAGVAAALEVFRATFARLVPGARTEPLAPVIVLAFDRFESYEPYAPRYDGRPIPVAGSFIGTSRANYLVLTLDDPDKAWTVAFHELTHLIVSQTLARPPTWFNEGIAEYYSTLRPAGSTATIELGHLVPDHLARLRRDPWIPLDELFAVSPDSPLYNEGDRRSMFYAESWAVVHYLLDDTARSRRLFDYLSRTANGQASASAFRAAFEMAPGTLQESVRRYVQQSEWPVKRYEMPPAAAGRVHGAVAIDSATWLAALAGLHLTLGRAGDAMALAQQSANSRPSSGVGWALLAASLTEQHLDVESAPFVQRAAADLPQDPFVLCLLGTSAIAVAERAQDSELPRPAALHVAIRSLEAAVRLSPGYAEAWATLAHAALNVGTEADLALRASRNARTLAPTRLHYRLFEAQALMQRGEWAAARRLMDELFELPLDPQLADKAAEVLARIAALESAVAPPAPRR
ncbi:MAG: hypothetical protein AB7I50_02800 [Vicinamibacterales bacterium]